MIDEINKEIEKFLSSIVNNKKNINSIIKKCSTSISDDLKKGHITSNVCMVAASILKLNPKDLAEDLKTRLEKIAKFDNVEVAGPGFINISLNREDFVSTIEFINKNKDSFGSSAIGKKNKVQIEFVSANPTGPLHVGHGRGAAYGDAIGRILESTGSIVEKEYYVNDAGRQIDILTASVILRLIKNDISNYFPANGYKGEYIDEIGKKLDKKVKIHDFKSLSIKSYEDPEEEIDNIIHELEKLNNNSWNLIKKFSLKEIVKSIEDDLKAFNVNFDKWFYESSLGKIDDDSSDIALSVNKLIKDGHAYEKDKAIWLNTDISGDDKHRVLVRDNGKATYFASDVAYHKNKIDRGFDKLINIWGADHHGYISRIQGAFKIFAKEKSSLNILLVQFANLFRGKEKVSMSTRSGDFITLKQLTDEVGKDAMRFFYLMRKSDQHMDFDIELAKSSNSNNPVYYVQYAHARICSIFRKLNEDKKKFNYNKDNLKNLSKEEELKIINKLSAYPDIIIASANKYEPHLITNYLRELSQEIHSYYNKHQILVEEEDLRNARLSLMEATKYVFENSGKIIGINMPDKM